MRDGWEREEYGRVGCSGAERRRRGSEGISTELLQEGAKLLQRELL